MIERPRVDPVVVYYVMETFFRPERIFAVVGASTNPTKFGNKVLKWYVDRRLPVVPINPKEKNILSLDTVPALSELVLPEGKQLSLSVVTPPSVTKSILQSVGPSVVSAVWLQPGTYNNDVLDVARSTVPTVITDCILVNGDRAIRLSKL